MKAPLLLALLLGACVAPTQHDESRFGRVTVAFGPSLDGVLDWRADQLTELRAELLALNALGPTFVEATEGTAQLVVREFDSGDHCAAGVGRFTPGTSFVEVDPACAAGYLALRSAVAHELMHALGAGHVCIEAGELPSCSPVGFGPAIMNPQNSYGDPVDPGMYTGVSTDVPTQLDIDEYNRSRR